MQSYADFASRLAGYNYQGVDYTVLGFAASVDQITIKCIHHLGWSAALFEIG